MKRYNHSYLDKIKKDSRKRKLLFDCWLIRFSLQTVDDEGKMSTVRVILPLTEFLYNYYHYHNIREFHKQIETLRKVNPDGIEYMLDPNTLPAGIERDVLFIPVICPRYGYKWNRKQILNCFNIAPNSTLRILSPYLFYWKNDLRNIFKKHFKNILREINQHTKQFNKTFHPINITPPKYNSKTSMFLNNLYEETVMMMSYRDVMEHGFFNVDVVV